jgi:hypothetical protein
MGKINCWEFKKCGREKAGLKKDTLGLCPTATEKELNGINAGKNGGRVCWAIAGSLCNGQVQGTFASKLKSCLNYNFYYLVRKEEGNAFQGIGKFISRIT